MKKKTEKITVERVLTDEKTGLSSAQVEKRVAAGLTNEVKNKNSKSYLKIVADNVCTFYNLLCLAAFVVLLTVHRADTPLSNYAFIVIYLVNIAIGITQEVRAKRTLDNISLVKAPTAKVVRDGEEKAIPVSELVPDDIVELSLGMQIPADCRVLVGDIELDESLLTGESVAVKKSVGDELFGGSFVSGGSAVARVEKVGEACYVSSLTQKAKKFKKTQSELLSTMKRIINVVGFLIVPIAVLSGLINYNHLSATMPAGDALNVQTVTRTVAVVIGMIPGGMFLLTTVALAVGIVKLAKKDTLVQDMYSLEMLARVNVLCLDKTGTITDGKLNVAEVFHLSGKDYSDVIYNMQKALNTSNPTANALIAGFSSNEQLEATALLPFSSKRKFSAVTFKNEGTFLLGAPEYVMPAGDEKVSKIYERESEKGRRVILLAAFDGAITEDGLTEGKVTPLTVITLDDNVRPEAIEAIKWFKANDVQVKVISGDNPVTVSRISAIAGVEGAEKCISLAGLTDEEVVAAANEYTVFGRVSPEQKALLVKTIKSGGARVAMTGDGVNDILAMKEADCSITVASGNSSARALAHLLLLNDDFNSMPQVVKEGRQVINNVERSSALYLMKTAFIILLAVVSIIMGRTYPLTTGDMLPMEMIIIGISSLALTLQPNGERVKGRFITSVMINALPGTFIMLFSVLMAENAHLFGVNVAGELGRAAIVFALTFGGFAQLIVLSLPLDRFRTTLCCIVFAVLIVWAFLLSATPIFKLPALLLDKNFDVILFTAILTIIDVPLGVGVKALLKSAFSPKK